MTVVPRHKIGCAVGAVEFDPWDIEVSVANCTRRENHGVVVAFEIIEADVGPEVDIPENPNTARVKHIPQRIDDPLDSGVVRSDAVSDEPVGGGEAVKQVD